MRFFITIFTLLLLFYASSVTSKIIIQDGGYTNLLVTFSPRLNGSLVTKAIHELKDLLTSASEILYNATNHRTYFKSVTILIPPDWENDTLLDYDIKNASWELFEKDALYVTTVGINSKDISSRYSSGCGKQGEGIYIPNSALMKENANKFIHHWSHFRYGVFDEYLKLDEFKGYSCYFNGTSWNIIGCYGANFNISIFDERYIMTGDQCYWNVSKEWFYENNKLHSSLMADFNIASTMDKYCDGSEKYPHDPWLPTPHNVHCKGKSVWDVIRSSEDFQYKQYGYIDKVIPEINLVKETIHEYIFVVQNGSSSNNKIENFVQVIRGLQKYFSVHFPRNVDISLITFAEKCKIFSANDPKKITNYIEKELLKVFPPISDYNNLTCGLNIIVDAFQNQLKSTTVVIIATEESLNSVKPNIMESVINFTKGRLIIIPLPTLQMFNFDEIVIHSNGYIFSLFASEAMTENHVIIESVSMLNIPYNSYNNNMLIYYNFFSESSHLNGEFSIGNDIISGVMYLYFVYDKILIRDVIFRVNGGAYENGNVISIKEDKQEWKFSFESNVATKMLVYAVAENNLQKNPFLHIRIRGWLSSRKVSFKEKPPIIYAELKSGEDYITKADVIAFIYPPGETVPLQVQLRDNGNGDPDIFEEDGVYTRYFTKLTKVGRYLVVISASHDRTHTSDNMLKFSRAAVIGSFVVTEIIPEKADIYPPNRITDLKVIRVNEKTLTMKWTAPGDDYDSGIVSSYEVKYDSLPEKLLDQTFSYNKNFLIQLHKFNYNESGSKEILEFRCPENICEGIYFVAMRAVDKAGNNGEISNMVQISVLKKLTTITTTIHETTPDTLPPLTTSVPNSTNIDPKIGMVLENDKQKFIIAISVVTSILLITLIVTVIIAILYQRQQRKILQLEFENKNPVLPLNSHIYGGIQRQDDRKRAGAAQQNFRLSNVTAANQNSQPSTSDQALPTWKRNENIRSQQFEDDESGAVYALPYKQPESQNVYGTVHKHSRITHRKDEPNVSYIHDKDLERKNSYDMGKI